MADGPILKEQQPRPVAASKPWSSRELLETGFFPLRNDKYNDYRDIQAIGQGTSGIARRAIGPDGNVVVIKELKTVLLPGMSEEACKHAIDVFGKEAGVLKQLFHPNIPQYVDSFSREVEGETRFCIVSQYIEGKSLGQLIKEGRKFNEAEAKDILRQMLDIMKYLQGFTTPILHRDIKPNNIIIDPQGKCWLSDFGTVALEQKGTFQGTMCGTPGFAPIEQIAYGKATTSSDVHGLGATIISMVTGKDPDELKDDNHEIVLGKHANISPEFAAVLEKMVRFQESDRFQNAKEVSEALEGMGRAMVPAASSVTSGLAQLEKYETERKKAAKGYRRELGRRKKECKKELSRKAKEIHKMVVALNKMAKKDKDFLEGIQTVYGECEVSIVRGCWFPFLIEVKAGDKSKHIGVLQRSSGKIIGTLLTTPFGKLLGDVGDEIFNYREAWRHHFEDIKDALSLDENAYHALMQLPAAVSAKIAEEIHELSERREKLLNGNGTGNKGLPPHLK